jgi:hypothetical protein
MRPHDECSVRGLSLPEAEVEREQALPAGESRAMWNAIEKPMSERRSYRLALG